MSTRLILLGVLNSCGKSLHGYEIKKVLEDWKISEFTEITFGSLYYNLEKMEKDGLVESRVVKNSARPERRLYSITEEGKKEFMNMLRRNYFEVERFRFSFDVGLLFMPSLPKEEVLEALNRRISAVDEMILSHRNLLVDLRGKIPFFALDIIEHHLIHWEAEKEWLEKIREEVSEAQW